jgi:hypothetical protein
MACPFMGVDSLVAHRVQAEPWFGQTRLRTNFEEPALASEPLSEIIIQRIG